MSTKKRQQPSKKSRLPFLGRRRGSAANKSKASSRSNKHNAKGKHNASNKTKSYRFTLQLGSSISVELVLKRANRRSKKPTRRRNVKKQSITARVSRLVITTTLLLAGIVGTTYYGINLYEPDSPLPVVSYSPPVPAVKQGRIDKPPVLSMEPSSPVSLLVKDLGIDAPIITVGREPNGTMELPKSFSSTGWYRFGPTPGETGPAIIVGHVDSIRGPAVFWKLGQIAPNQLVEVKRADGLVAKFVVTAIKQYEQSSFPTEEVYGNIDYPGLRLITCGGQFDRASRKYSHNIVVYAKLVK